MSLIQEKTTSTEKEPGPSGYREHWSFKYIALIIPLFGLVLLDSGLRLTGIQPPDDPLVFHVKTHTANFTPFVENESGWVTIRPDWVKKDEMYRFTAGTQAGRIFMHPGFRPTRFSKHKPPGTLRIFAFGGFTTFGQWVGPEGAFPLLLEGLLRNSADNRDIEVINLGCPGLESARVSTLLKRALEFDPDLLLVYTGNNELLRGPDMPSRSGDTLLEMRAWLLRWSTLMAWFNYGFKKFFRPGHYEIVSEEIAALEAGKIVTHNQSESENGYTPLPKEYLNRVVRNYTTNLETMAKSAQESKIPLLFVLPVPNLRHPPEQSAHAPTFKDRPRFNELLASCELAMAAGDLNTALERVDAAVAMSPGYAMGHYLRGTVLLEMRLPVDAQAAFQKAVDENVYTHRITAPLQYALNQLTREMHVPLVDPRPLFYDELDLDSAQMLFADHCHPSKLGHWLLAGLLLPHALQALGFSM